MKKPFVFGKAVSDSNFIGREEESERLRQNFSYGVNTILMSPRRWGKTSIVHRIGDEVKSGKLLVVYMDIFSCRDEYDFYNKFAEQILIQTESRFEKWKELASDFIARLSPKINYSIDGGVNEYSVSLGITSKSHKPEEVLQLPQIIAQKKNCDIVVCIDEFQQVGEFPNSLAVQKRMRGVWQLQENVSYCLYGSKKHMMEAIFLKKTYPFYKFGEIIPLKLIPIEKWIPYIRNGFEMGNKQIINEYITQICESTEYNPSYVQQYSWILFTNTKNAVDESSLKQSLQDLIDENSPLFMHQTESLTTFQLNFIRAILNGIHTNFGSAEIREQYHLGSYSNINRIKKSLIDKELIDDSTGEIHISDPVLRMWLEQNI